MEKPLIIFLLPHKVYMKSCMQARELRCSFLKQSSGPKMGSEKKYLAPILLLVLLYLGAAVYTFSEKT